MEIFNVGFGELLFVLVLMLILFGPQGLEENARKLAAWVRRLTQNPTWRDLRETQRELTGLPNRLIREAGLDEWREQQEKIERLSGGRAPQAYRSPNFPENTILPPDSGQVIAPLDEDAAAGPALDPLSPPSPPPDDDPTAD